MNIFDLQIRNRKDRIYNDVNNMLSGRYILVSIEANLNKWNYPWAIGDIIYFDSPNGTLTRDGRRENEGHLMAEAVVKYKMVFKKVQP